jgi:hypothetical protein
MSPGCDKAQKYQHPTSDSRKLREKRVLRKAPVGESILRRQTWMRRTRDVVDMFVRAGFAFCRNAICRPVTVHEPHESHEIHEESPKTLQQQAISTVLMRSFFSQEGRKPDRQGFHWAAGRPAAMER